MRVISFFIQKWVWVFLIITLMLGFSLRAHDLYTWPRFGATFDEYAWTWLGINLIQHHVPTSWSRHPEYTHFTEIRYQHTPFRLVTPYLEHPPLFGLIAGGYALLSGVKDMYHVDLAHIRGLALLLGVLTIFIVFVYTSDIYDRKTGLIAAFLYAIIPSLVAGSRLVENENFFIPGFLLALYFASVYIKTKRILLRNLTALLCALLVLAKIPWATATLAIVLLFAYHKKYTDAVIILLSGLFGLALFFVYGFFYNAPLFLSLWQLQLNRYDIAFDSIFALFTTPMLTDRLYLDGWIYSGWFALTLLIQDMKKHVWVVLPFLAYFAVFIYAIPNEPGHGWYRYPFFPFLVMALAYFVRQYFNKNYLLSYFFLLLTGLSMFAQTWAPAFGFSFLLFRLYLIFSSLTLLPFFFPKTKNLGSILSYGILLFVILLTILASLSYNEQ